MSGAKKGWRKVMISAAPIPQSRENCGHMYQENKISFQGSEKKKDQHHTHAVNRAEGAVQKSTVHKFPVLYCSISDFRTPAYK